MTTIPRQPDMSPTGVFDNDDVPPRGFVGDIMTLLTRPAEFFRTFTRQTSQRTLLIAILILVVIGFNALQMTGSSDAAPIDGGANPVEGFPVDPNFPPDGGGGTAPTTSDPSAKWMTALTAVGTQAVMWSVLTLLLAEVPMFNGHKPQFDKNIQIVIWSSIPLALMAGLQLIFIMGGGTVSAIGFSGFLDEWSRFATLNIYLQSFIYALASQLTLFWLWSLWLIYLGAKLTLRGKSLVVVLVIALWVVILGVANAFPAYETLKANAPMNEEIIPDEMPFDSEMQPDESGMVFDEAGELLPETESEMLPDETGTSTEENAIDESDASIKPSGEGR